MSMTATPVMVAEVQSFESNGSSIAVGGSKYDNGWVKFVLLLD